MLIAYLLSISLTSANVDCADSICSSCTTGYLYNSVSCLSECPWAYAESATTCIPSLELRMFDLHFFDYFDFSGLFIGPFTAPAGLFLMNNDWNPMPTANQGFYFTVSSFLVLLDTDLIISPDFTLSFYYTATVNGNIFHMYDGSTEVMTVAMNSGNAQISLLLTDSLSQESLQTFTYSSGMSLGWISISLAASQGNGIFTITFFGTTFSSHPIVS